MGFTLPEGDGRAAELRAQAPRATERATGARIPDAGHATQYLVRSLRGGSRKGRVKCDKYTDVEIDSITATHLEQIKDVTVWEPGGKVGRDVLDQLRRTADAAALEGKTPKLTTALPVPSATQQTMLKLVPNLEFDVVPMPKVDSP